MQHACASSDGVEATWMLVDQDVGDPGAIRYPDLNDRGELIEGTWHAVSHLSDHPTGTTEWTGALDRTTPGLEGDAGLRAKRTAGHPPRAP